MPQSLDRLTAALAGRYRIERQVGSGGMATVYLAEDVKHHRQVALKVLRPELAAVLGPERFLREIEIAAQLNHPHILPLFDSGEAGGVLYYVMPYVAGESLRDRLSREKQLGIEDALQIAREVADALDYAHRQGVVHRDIKPENILLEERHAVVADFGIARAISVAGGEKLTATGVAVGTPEYMSPEQASGRGELDGRSDIYALGCVMYEMLAGEPPFTGPTVEAVLRQHLTAPAPLVTAIRDAVPQPATSAIHRALAKAPADRFASAGEFSASLGAAVPGAPAGLGTPGWRPGHFRLAALLAAAFVVVAGTFWVVGRRGILAPKVSAPTVPRLVVLPFENLGAPADSVFADGISEEIMARLAGLRGLAVISRQSAMQYKGTDKRPREIGDELSVQYMLEGTVRWQRLPDGSIRVRVTPQLIRIADDAHVWASVFDEPLSDVFRVQAEIAERIAGAMGVALSAGEQQVASERPTSNTGAYEYYLRGNAYFRAGFPVRAELFDAVAMYQRAVELDSTFALAYARLSLSHAGLSRGGQDRSAKRLENARMAAEMARWHQPQLPEANLAFAHYYLVGPREYDRAIEELTPILKLQPNNSDFLYMAAQVQRRRGDIAEAAASFAKASDLDPLAWSAAYEAGIANLLVRRYDLAERYIVRRQAIQPQWRPWPLAYLRLMRDGDAEQVRAWLEQGGTQFTVGEVVAAAALDYGYHALGLRVVRSLCGDCRNALEQTSQTSRSGIPPRVWYSGKAFLYSSMKQGQMAKIYFDSAAAELEMIARRDADWPHGGLARVYAALGRQEAALREADLASRQVPVSGEPFLAVGVATDLAETYVLAGATEKALENLEWVLSMPSWMSVGMLRADPIWDPIRNHPRFQALLAKYAER